jgi:hypothetical protein
MALLWMDGFDHYGTAISGDASTRLAKLYTVSNSNSILCSTGRYNQGSAVYMACGKYGTTRIYKPMTPTVGTTHLICGFNIYMAQVYGTNIQINSGWNGQTNGISINTNAWPNFALYCGPNYVATLTANAWSHIEIRIPITTSGSNKYELYLNGATVFSSSSLSFAWANALYFGTVDSHNNSGYHFGLDDLYVMDNTGSTNNARIGTELYIPRIETTYPVDDVTNNFTANSYTPFSSVTYGVDDLTGATNDAILNALATNLGFTNLSASIASPTGSYFQSNATSGIGGTRSLMLAAPTTSQGSFQFDTIASTFSFWYFGNATSSTILSVTVNGTETFLSLTGSYQQYTVTLDANKVNKVKINVSSGTGAKFVYMDNFAVTYTGNNAAQSLYRNPESSAYHQSTTNGNKLIGNIGNLNTINDVKAVGFCPLASESVSAVTSSYKLIANNGGSDTEIGTTQSVTGVTTARGLQIFNVNPLTSAAWTASDFNSLKAGVINKT